MKLLGVLLTGLTACQALALSAQGVLQTATQAESSADQLIIYKPGGAVTSPKLTYSIDPPYTDPARKKKLTGTTVLSLIVKTDGTPENIQIIHSLAEGCKPKLKAVAEGLDRSAVAAVEQYRFEPSTLNGKAVPVEIHIQVNFRLY